MTRALRDMMIHQCLARAMSKSIRVVEPFSENSQLFQPLARWNRQLPRFSDYYDLNYYNQKSEAEEGAPLVTWEEFLDKAARNAVLLVFPKQPCEWDTSPKNNGMTPMFGETEHCASKLKNRLHDLTKYNFSFIKTICIDCAHMHRALKIRELQQMVYGKRDVSEITLFMNSCRDYRFTGSWVTLPAFCKTIEGQGSHDRLTSSLSVTKHRKNYIDSLHLDGNVSTIAVMFRFERFFEQFGMSEDKLVDCLNKTTMLYDSLKHSYSNTAPLVTLDFGQFGSGPTKSLYQQSKITGTAEERLFRHINSTLEHIFHGPWSLNTWEMGFVSATGGITERGYIGMLQQSIAAHSDCLILLGGGGYQEVTAQQYVDSHRGHKCIHVVCVPRSWEGKFNRIWNPV